jgi:tRNA modification GTPase
LNDNRAIVSEIAGTTRDTIEEIININGILFRLIDTAGIREHTTDIIGNMGVIKSLEKIKQADVVLYLFDVNITDINALEIINKDLSHQNKKFILIGNKSDIISVDKKKNNYDDLEIQFISAKENIGIDELKSKLFLSVTENKTLTENIIVTNSRHYEALQQVEKSLHDIKDGLESKISGDLLALDIRRCLYYLGEITGEITNEDRLDYIFSKFCIGK